VIDGRGGEVAFLVARTIAEIVFLAAGVPTAFIGIDEIKTVLGLGVKTNAIEDEEFRLGTEKGLIGDAAIFQVSLGTDGDLTGIAWGGFVRYGIANITDKPKRGRNPKRIHESRIGMGHEQHVQLMNRLPAADGAAVKAESFFER